MERYYWQGNEAITYGAIDAGARFYAGYPITPSSEIAELSSVELPKFGGTYIQMEDELSSMAAICGAAATGKLAYTATSGPGFSLMQENLGVAVAAQLPCVVINVQRFGPSTGLATKPAQGDVMQSRWGTHGDHEIIALCPSSVQECYELTRRAFQLASRYRTPVILLADEVIGHLREGASVDRTPEVLPPAQPLKGLPYALDGTYEDDISPLQPFGGDFIIRYSGSMYGEDGLANGDPKNAERFVNHITGKIIKNRGAIVTTEYWGDPNADVVVVAYGCTARSAQEAVNSLRKDGISAAMLRLITLWPFADQEVIKVCANAKAVVVPEMNLGQVVGEVRKCIDPGKVIQVNQVNAHMIAPGKIAAISKGALKQ